MNSDPTCFHPYVFLSSNLKCNFNARVCVDRCQNYKHRYCYENLIQIDDLKTQYRLKLMKDKDKMEELITEIKKIYETKLNQLEQAKERAICQIQKIFQIGRKEHLRSVKCDEVTMQILQNNRFDRMTCDMVYKIREFTKLQSFAFIKKGLNVVEKFHKGYKQKIRNKGKDSAINGLQKKDKYDSSEEVVNKAIKREEDEFNKKERGPNSDFRWTWIQYGTEENPVDLSS